ncbi:MAG: GntR family transcriptional regulator [bacterium]
MGDKKMKQPLRLTVPAFKSHGLVDQICNVLTHSILMGELTGGVQLKELELQNYFKTSRSPIREALREMEKRGLVALKPRRGAFVKAVTAEEIGQSFKTRAVLEGLAACEARDRLTAEDLQSLETQLDRMRDAVREKDVEQYKRSVYLFHRTFIRCSNNRAVISCLKSLPVYIMWRRFLVKDDSEEMVYSVRQHEKIMQLFLDRSGSMDELEKAVRALLESSARRLNRNLERENMLDQ